MNTIPEFDAYELNMLRAHGRKHAYYQKCLKFVEDVQSYTPEQIQALTDKQIKWLWGIKADIKEM